MTVIELSGATLAYGAHAALRDVDLALDQGVAALIGPNGSGKSTLLAAVSGLLRPTSGTVRVLGRRAGEAGSRVALLLQQTTHQRVLPVTVREVVTMGRYAHHNLLSPLRRRDRAAVDEALARMDVTDLATRHLGTLSGGQRQRVLVAQALAQQAQVILLDEPVTGLDLVSQRLILEAVSAERDAGRTVVLTTHDLADAGRADTVVVLAGRVVAVGPPEEVLVPEVLRQAYGRRLVPLEGDALIDDSHHAHDHPDQAIRP